MIETREPHGYRGQELFRQREHLVHDAHRLSSAVKSLALSIWQGLFIQDVVVVVVIAIRNPPIRELNQLKMNLSADLLHVLSQL